METSLVPKLQHLACSRIVASLFNHLEVHKNIPEEKLGRRRCTYEKRKYQVKEAVPCLTSSALVQKELERFIDPLLQEMDDCLLCFDEAMYRPKSVFSIVRASIPQCWMSDGTINREEVARLIVKNENSDQFNRFIFACTYCLFSDALEAWDALFPIERAFLKTKSTEVVKLWINWFESRSTRDWESFLTWSLGTPLWHSNVSILKHALQKIKPEDRSYYLLNGLIGKEVDNDVMRFCISVTMTDVKDQIFRESTTQVFSCLLSWPLRRMFFVMADNLWPYFTEQIFCNALEMILTKILKQKTGDVDLLNILEHFWAVSPEHFQNAAKDNFSLFKLAQVTWNSSRYLLNQGLPEGFWKDFLDKREIEFRASDVLPVLSYLQMASE